jgi:murein tripeptide amidase MpaA
VPAPALAVLFAVLLALMLHGAALAQATPGDGVQPLVVTIGFADGVDANRLAGQLDVWEIDHASRTLVAYVTPVQLAALQAEGYSVQPRGDLDAASIPNFACYRTVDETYSDMAQLATGFPHLARWIDIGDSWLKVTSGGDEGNDLYTLVLTNAAIRGPKPRLFVMAAIHARELTTAEIATRFAELLLNRYGKDPQATWLLDYNEVHIVPQANPDGRQRAEEAAAGPIGNPNLLWRKNVNNGDGCIDSQFYGVDLNRNHSFRWAGCQGFGCSSSYACDLTYRGRAAASEPETQAVEAYLRSIFPDQRGPTLGDAAPDTTQGVMISLHSYSQLVLFPWGWSAAPAPNATGLRTLGRKFGYFTNYRACQSGEPGCLYQTDGSSDDFSYGELGIASYTFELGTAFFQDCASFERDILPQTLEALTYAAQVAVQPYRLAAGPDVVTATVQPAAVKAGALVTLTVQIDDSRTLDDPIFGSEPVQPIAGATYTVDAPGWCGTATPAGRLAAVDEFDSPRESASAIIDTTGWAAGRHTVFVQATDQAGNRGAAAAAFVDVGGSQAAQPKPCAGLLYLPLWLGVGIKN